MKNLLKLVAVAIAAAALQSPAMAAPVLDQNNAEHAGVAGFCFATPDALCGQSFKQAGSTISGAGFYIAPGYLHGDSTLNISIFSAYGSAPSGLVASGSTTVATGYIGWVDVFWAPAMVNAESQYYMVLSSDAYVVPAYSNVAAYANGNALHGGSPSNWSGYDLVFRTFADDGDTQQVPEPGSLALLGLGLTGLAFAARKKRG